MTYRGPNESQYLANLNAINPVQTSPGSASQAFDDSFPIDDDLSLFASTQFFDFDNMAESMVGGVKEEKEAAIAADATATRKSAMGFLDELNDFGFHYNDMLPILPDEHFAVPTLPAAGASTSKQTKTILPSPSARVNPISSSSSSSVTSPTVQTLPNHLKRKSSTITPVESAISTPEDSSTVLFAAEEDKRRRNTAASARFRVKKKQREQALEVHAKELESKCQALQEKVNQLELENKWLKDLITDRKDSK